MFSLFSFFFFDRISLCTSPTGWSQANDLSVTICRMLGDISMGHYTCLSFFISPCITIALAQTIQLLCDFSWGDVNKHLFIPGKTLIMGQGNSHTCVYLRESVSLLGLLIGEWFGVVIGVWIIKVSCSLQHRWQQLMKATSVELYACPLGSLAGQRVSTAQQLIQAVWTGGGSL